MGFLNGLTGFFRPKQEHVNSVSLAEAREIVKQERTAEEKALLAYVPPRFAEIKHLILSLAKNSEALGARELELEGGNRRYKHIVDTSRKNLVRKISGLTAKLMPPTSITVENTREYARQATKALTTDLLPYWKNVSLAKLQFKEEVGLIGQNLRELTTILQELESRIIGGKVETLRMLEKKFEGLEKIHAHSAEVEEKISNAKREAGQVHDKLVSLKSGIASKKASPEAAEWATLLEEKKLFEAKRDKIVSEFNTKVAPLEKVLKRMAKLGESGVVTEKERQVIELLLTTPYSAFLSDPNGFNVKNIFIKSEHLIRNGSISLKESEREKKLGLLSEMIKKDFFGDYFWRINRLNSELLSLEKRILSLRFSAELKEMEVESVSLEKEFESKNSHLVELLKIKNSSSERSAKEALGNEFNSVFEGRFSIRF